MSIMLVRIGWVVRSIRELVRYCRRKQSESNTCGSNCMLASERAVTLNSKGYLSPQNRQARSHTRQSDMSALRPFVSALSREKPRVCVCVHPSETFVRLTDPLQVVDHRVGRSLDLGRLQGRAVRRVCVCSSVARSSCSRPHSLPELATSISLQPTG